MASGGEIIGWVFFLLISMYALYYIIKLVFQMRTESGGTFRNSSTSQRPTLRPLRTRSTQKSLANDMDHTANLHIEPVNTVKNVPIDKTSDEEAPSIPTSVVNEAVNQQAPPPYNQLV